MNQMIEAYKDAVTKNYANFKGRLGLAGYWWFFLVNVIVGLLLFVLWIAIHWIFLVLLLGYSLAMIAPGLAAAVRRLHDTGKSGWWVLIYFVPLVGGIILIVLLAQAGQAGENAYGPPPVPTTAPGVQPA